MKKFILLFFVIGLLLSFISCDSEDTSQPITIAADDSGTKDINITDEEGHVDLTGTWVRTIPTEEWTMSVTSGATTTVSEITMTEITYTFTVASTRSTLYLTYTLSDVYSTVFDSAYSDTADTTYTGSTIDGFVQGAKGITTGYAGNLTDAIGQIEYTGTIGNLYPNDQNAHRNQFRVAYTQYVETDVTVTNSASAFLITNTETGTYNITGSGETITVTQLDPDESGVRRIYIDGTSYIQDGVYTLQ